MSDFPPIAGKEPASRVYFGGPDKPPRALRDLLQARIDAVPPGGEIVWSTYYFRDRALAAALIAASDRGVAICLHVEGDPRFAGANDRVVEMLESHGLKGGLHVHRPRLAMLAPVHPHLHSKIYCFSHPAPHVLIGSFNPSGDQPEERPDVIAEIGDQDRGHNLLVQFHEPVLVAGLRTHVLGLSRAVLRFRRDQNRPVEADGTRLWFYPRLSPAIIDRHLAGLGRGSSVSGAISHLKPGFLVDALMRAAKAGTSVRLLVHDTERRVPAAIVRQMTDAGANILRYVHPEGLPMHGKFLLIDGAGGRTGFFGSFNYNSRSRYLNHEVLASTCNPAVIDSLAARLNDMIEQAQKFGAMQ